MKFYFVSLLLGSWQFSASGQNVFIGLDTSRKRVNERDGLFTLCANVLRSTINDYSTNVSVIYQDRGAVGKIIKDH